MLIKKNIKLGKTKIFSFLLFIFFFLFNIKFCFANNLEGSITNIKILDKISSKNILIKLDNGKNFKHKDLLIKSIK